MYLSPEQVKFLDAAGRGDVETVNAMLSGGVDVNTPDIRSLPRNRTALMHAAGNGHLEIVERLLAVGARLDTRDKGMGPSLPGGYTALLLALENKHARIAQTLLRAGADPNIACRGQTTLGQAAGLGDVPLVRQLLKSGVDPNWVPGKKSDLPLVNALFANHTEVVRALLSGGADPNLPRTRGRQPLELAIQDGLADATQLLLHRGADADQLLAGGLTPLMAAAHHGQKHIVRILLKRGVTVNARNKRGLTALDFAQRRLDQPSGNEVTLFRQRRGLSEPEYLAQFHEITALLRNAGGHTSIELPPQRGRARAKSAPRQPPRPAPMSKNSAPPRGVKDFLEMVRYVEPEFSVMAVKASLEKTAAAFADIHRIKKWICAAPCHPRTKPGRPLPSVLAFVRIKHNTWTVILRSVFFLDTDGFQWAPETARALSIRLRTKAMSLVRSAGEETLEYHFFGRGRRWEHAVWTEQSSANRFRSRFRRRPGQEESSDDFIDKVFRQQRLYLPACHVGRTGRRIGLNIAPVSVAAIQRADIAVLSPTGKTARRNPPRRPRRR